VLARGEAREFQRCTNIILSALMKIRPMKTSWSPYWRPVPTIPYLRLKLLASPVYMFFFAVVCLYTWEKQKIFVPD